MAARNPRPKFRFVREWGEFGSTFRMYEDDRGRTCIVCLRPRATRPLTTSIHARISASRYFREVRRGRVARRLRPAVTMVRRWLIAAYILFGLIFIAVLNAGLAVLAAALLLLACAAKRGR
jgi:hypothetical protein